MQEKKETNEKVARNEFMYLPGTVENGREESVLIKRSKQCRSMMHKYMQVQSYRC